MSSHKNNGQKMKQRHSPYSTGTWKERKQGLIPPPPNQNPSGPPESDLPPGGGYNNESLSNDYIPDPEGGRREKKFGNRARVYIGNLPRGMTEEELMELFSPHGEVSRVYLEKEKNFGFARMAYRDQAMKAISSLNGINLKGRELRVRFAASSCSVKVSNLHPTVSNELLFNAFGTFGEVEHAVVVTDERGKSLGHGFVDFAKKTQAMAAIDRCRQGVFLLTKSPVPVVVSELVRENEDDGLAERDINKSAQYHYERDSIPRMAVPGTPEFDFGMRFKELYDNEQRSKEQLDKTLKETRERLEAEMEQFKHHEHANVLRLQLAEYQKEQELIQQRLHRHEQFIRGPPPPGGPPLHILPPPPPHMMPGQPLLPPGPPRPPQPPQPLLAINDTPPRGPVPPNPLIARPAHGPPSVPGNVPTFLLPSPGGQNIISVH
uniref:RRM domain-containing protein n=1 Tax=Amphimedon queenslandica TaxID=400682 RepID=A0A1X7TYJ2_AMPQE